MCSSKRCSLVLSIPYLRQWFICWSTRITHVRGRTLSQFPMYGAWCRSCSQSLICKMPKSLNFHQFMSVLVCLRLRQTYKAPVFSDRLSEIVWRQANPHYLFCPSVFLSCCSTVIFSDLFKKAFRLLYRHLFAFSIVPSIPVDFLAGKICNLHIKAWQEKFRKRFCGAYSSLTIMTSLPAICLPLVIQSID